MLESHHWWPNHEPNTGPLGAWLLLLAGICWMASMTIVFHMSFGPVLTCSNSLIHCCELLRVNKMKQLASDSSINHWWFNIIYHWRWVISNQRKRVNHYESLSTILYQSISHELTIHQLRINHSSTFLNHSSTFLNHYQPYGVKHPISLSQPVS